MVLEKDSVIAIFLSAILQPMYIFLTLCAILWIYEGYSDYSILILASISFGIGNTLS